jgi:hypothetical protein
MPLTEDEKFIHDVATALAERQKFAATVVNRENEPLATGEGFIKDGRGTFWPGQAALKDIPASNAVMLRCPGAADIPIRDFRLCALTHYSVHYHFRA